MCNTLAVAHYEYLMQIRRPGLWLSSVLLGSALYLFLLRDRGAVPAYYLSEPLPWKLGANLIATFNQVMPLVAGILVADRFPRDRQLGMTALLNTSRLSRRALALGKYLGSLLAVLTPSLVVTAACVAYLSITLGLPLLFLTVPVVFMVVALPSWLFVTAWSLLFPIILPLRIYQVAFAGFWLWAVAVTPEHLPTINHSIFSVQGQYALSGFFFTGPTPFLHPQATPGWAALNIGLLGGLTVLGLVLLPAVLRWREKRAGG